MHCCVRGSPHAGSGGMQSKLNASRSELKSGSIHVKSPKENFLLNFRHVACSGGKLNSDFSLISTCLRNVAARAHHVHQNRKARRFLVSKLDLRAFSCSSVAGPRGDARGAAANRNPARQHDVFSMLLDLKSRVDSESGLRFF